MNSSTKLHKKQKKHVEEHSSVDQSHKSHTSKHKKQKKKYLEIFEKTQVSLQSFGDNSISLHTGPVVTTEIIPTTADCSNLADSRWPVNIKREVIPTEECSAQAAATLDEDATPINTSKTKTRCKTKKPSAIIPLTLCEEVSDLIHASNTVRPIPEKTCEFMLANYGILLRKTKWTPEEDKILRTNYEKALEAIPKDDHQHILGVSKESPIYLQRRIRLLKREAHFYSTLGHSLNRPNISCLARAKHIFKDYKNTGMFSQEEVKQLDQLVKIHGHKWDHISRAMGRSAYSVSSYFHKGKPKGGVGLFTPLEHQQLHEAYIKVKEEHDIPDDQVKNIPWSQIAERVPTRTITQCKVHWLHRVNRHKENNFERIFIKSENRKLLVELINDAEVVHEFDLNWEDICKQISSNLTPQYLQIYWSRMKKTFVPNYRMMSFDDVREYLYNKFHPS